MTTNHTELCERLRTISSCPGWDEAREAAALIESQAARIQQQAARVAELQKALKGLSSMYTFAWDAVDGGLFMNQDGTLRFEDAHKEARRVLGVELMEVDENGELTPEHEERTKLAARIAELEKERDALKADAERLNAIINTPQSGDFLRAVSIEAEHQRQRWGSSHDAGKAPADWFWLVGYLGGKALHAHAAGNIEKAEHHIITTAAACENWHKNMFGKTDMRPGIDGDAALQAEKETRS